MPPTVASDHVSTSDPVLADDGVDVVRIDADMGAEQAAEAGRVERGARAEDGSRHAARTAYRAAMCVIIHRVAGDDETAPGALLTICG